MLRLSRKGPVKAAMFMAAQTRMMCPRNSDTMVNSIKRKGNKVQVSGIDPRTGFPYIHWVNATPGRGLERIRLVRPFSRDGGIYSYAQVARTGTPRFFSIAMERTRINFRQGMLRDTRRILNASF